MQFYKKRHFSKKVCKKNEFRKNSPATAPRPNRGDGQGMHPPFTFRRAQRKGHRSPGVWGFL